MFIDDDKTSLLLSMLQHVQFVVQTMRIIFSITAVN